MSTMNLNSSQARWLVVPTPADDAREHVGDAAGGEGHDVADRLLRVGLLHEGSRRGEEQGTQRKE